ncbi:MAG: DsbA family protein [Granulosicoccus sp.]
MATTKANHNPVMPDRLYYIHDPMCSWCWGFRPVHDELINLLPDNIKWISLLGGLAPDNDTPMSPDMQASLQKIWHKIADTIPGTAFNFDFWIQNVPRRSTWPACRAVLLAAQQDASLANKMTTAIQSAYYLDARNPSDTKVLVDLAMQIGCDTSHFEEELHSEQTRSKLMKQITFARQLGAQGFPSLILVSGRSDTLSTPSQDTLSPSTVNSIAIDYHSAATILERVEQLRAA